MSEDVQGRRIRSLKPGGPLRSVAWSPDGTRLAVGSGDNSVYVLTPEGRVLWRGRGHTQNVWSVAWSPDGRRMASGSQDNTVRLWDATTGTSLLTAEGHTDSVYAVAWSPAGRRLASGSYDKIVRVWDPTNGNLLAQFNGHQSAVEGVAWSPDGLRLASAAWDETVAIWDADSGTRLLQYDGHKDTVTSVAWSPDGQRIASGSYDQTIHVWNAATGKVLQQCNGHSNQVWSVAWLPDGGHLASGSWDNTVRLWNPENGQQITQVGTHDNYIWSVAFSPDGTRLASASSDETIALWDVSDLAPATPQPQENATALWLRRQAATVGRRPPDANERTSPSSTLPSQQPLPTVLAPLPGALAACQRLKQYPTLSLLRDLRDLLGGQPADALAPLAANPGVGRLVRLHWPGPARVGLAALLMRDVPDDTWQDWKPPAEVSPSELREQLTKALAGDEIPPEAPTPPLALLTKAADAVDERLVTLLTALGPDAVAADPGLPLRILHEAPSVPKMSEPQRR
ncbi:MAG: WD40 repeat domain-containing protein, partial [bacterium]|nr:WD40 repeat domain-containing protein [bacterium]